MLKSAITSIAFGLSALALSAQPVLKIVTVDTGKLLENYYKTEEQIAKLKDAQTKVNADFEKMVKELNDAVEKYKETVDQSKNTVLTAEARSKAEADSQKMLEDIQRRQSEAQTFRANNQQSLQQRFNNVRSILLDEITKKVLETAKSKGATLVLDKSGLSLLGVPSVIYADASYDITDEVMTELNKDRPPSTTPAPSSTTQPAPTTSNSAQGPMVTVPGLNSQK